MEGRREIEINNGNSGKGVDFLKASSNGKFQQDNIYFPNSISSNGYFTVEAAFIVPIALGTMVFIIYMMFLQYDRCLLEQDIGVLAMRGTVNFREDGQTTVDFLNGQAESVYVDKYVAFLDGGVDIRVKGAKVTVRGKGRVVMPFVGGKGVEVSFTNRKMDPVTFIRACRKLHSDEK